MIALIQRVTEAAVTVDAQIVGKIGRGVLALVGVQRGDDDAAAARLLERVLTYRIFEDEAGRMNRSLADIAGGLLLVPQFTLAADTRKGTRAGFSGAEQPERAESAVRGAGFDGAERATRRWPPAHSARICRWRW